jgi:hypothetical protein
MSRSNVRRLTACLVLAALLGLAVPAAAAPGWPLSPGVHGTGLLGQVFAWIGRLWAGEVPQPASMEKGGTTPTGKDPGRTPTAESDLSSTTDPNG